MHLYFCTRICCFGFCKPCILLQAMNSLFLLVASLRGRNFWKAGNAWIATIAIVLEAASPEILVGRGGAVTMFTAKVYWVFSIVFSCTLRGGTCLVPPSDDAIWSRELDR